MGRRWILIGVVVVALLGAPASAHAGGFLAGASVVDTTPVLGAPGSAAFGPSSLLCPQPLFPHAGAWALQEPYADSNPSGAPNVYCDANGNGRWDGIWADNGQGPAKGVNDPIEVRAVAISDGHDRPVVYASVDQIGIFDFYTEDARALLRGKYGMDADLVVSADHNESSPDSIGLYGALQTPAGVGLRSGIDEYFMSWLDDRIAQAARNAVAALRPATLWANQVETVPADGSSGNRYPLLTGLSQRISDQFPTTVALPADNRLAAIDTKLGVVQARAADGSSIFTVMSAAAHNQEMGNSGPGLSADWPGAFERAADAAGLRTAMFLVADNGSEEDPQTDPPVIPNGSENHTSQATQYVQAQATGRRFAAITGAAASSAQELTPGPVRLVREQICIPLENNGFAALAAAGVFGKRQGYACANGKPVAPIPNGFASPTTGAQFRTFVGYTDIGPDLQLIDNPGESFPALMLGSPFGVEDESCPRPNPAVPTWHSRGLFRFQAGLADDLIGYLIPAWGFASGTPGLFNNDTCYQDQNGHRHKLESESIGPTGANDVANSLASMLDSERDPSARVVQGRFVRADGSYSRWATGAVGMAVAGGTLLGSPTTAGFGGRAVNQTALFMDYDGQPQRSPDLTTRGMMVLGSDGCVAARYYLDVFPDVSGLPGLGHAVGQPAVLPGRSCSTSDRGGVPELQRGAAAQAGLTGHLCAARRGPSLTVKSIRVRRRRLRIAGRARGFGCARVARVVVSVVRTNRKRCRFMGANGHLSHKRSCKLPYLLLARGRGAWVLTRPLHVPRGRYTIVVTVFDTTGGHRRASSLRLRFVHGRWVTGR